MGKGFSMRAAGAAAAEILIYEDIGESWFGGVSAKQFATDLKALGNVTSIDVRINSYGGDVFDGLAIYRQLVEHKASVTTYVDGIAASIASVIAMAGEQIHIAEAGEMMIHDAWGISAGPAEDHRAIADRLDAVSASLADVYAARTGQGATQIRAWMRATTTMGAAQAVERGFATTMMPNLQMAARAEPSTFWRAWRAAHPAAADAAPPPPPDGAPPARPLYEARMTEINRQRARALLALPVRA